MVVRNKDAQMPCFVQRGSPAAAFLWMFDSVFGGQCWRESFAEVPVLQ